MAQRSAIVKRAKLRAGSQFLNWEQSQSVDLTTDYDEVLKEITRRYPILHGETTNNTTAGQNYITMPADYANRRYLIIGNNSMEWIEPDAMMVYLRTQNIANGVPDHYSVMPEDSKIYITPPCNNATAYYFGYDRVHNNTANDTTNHNLGIEYDDGIIDLLASRCCGYVEGMESKSVFLSKVGWSKVTMLAAKVKPTSGTRTTFWDTNWRMK